MSDAGRLFKLQGSEPLEGKQYRRNITEYVLAADILTALSVAQEKHPQAEFHDVKNMTPRIHVWDTGEFTDARAAMRATAEESQPES